MWASWPAWNECPVDVPFPLISTPTLRIPTYQLGRIPPRRSFQFMNLPRRLDSLPMCFAANLLEATTHTPCLMSLTDSCWLASSADAYCMEPPDMPPTALHQPRGRRQATRQTASWRPASTVCVWLASAAAAGRHPMQGTPAGYHPFRWTTIHSVGLVLGYHYELPPPEPHPRPLAPGTDRPRPANQPRHVEPPLSQHHHSSPARWNSYPLLNRFLSWCYL